MSEDILIFYCNNCNTKLSVPSNLGGSEDFCPNCEELVVSPSNSKASSNIVEKKNNLDLKPQIINNNDNKLIKFYCNCCSKTLEVPIKFEGCTDTCPNCGNTTTAPYVKDISVEENTSKEINSENTRNDHKEIIQDNVIKEENTPSKKDTTDFITLNNFDTDNPPQKRIDENLKSEQIKPENTIKNIDIPEHLLKKQFNFPSPQNTENKSTSNTEEIKNESDQNENLNTIESTESNKNNVDNNLTEKANTNSTPKFGKLINKNLNSLGLFNTKTEKNDKTESIDSTIITPNKNINEDISHNEDIKPTKLEKNTHKSPPNYDNLVIKQPIDENTNQNNNTQAQQAQQPNPSTLQNTSSTPINPNLTNNEAPVMPEKAPKPQTFGHPSDIPTQNNNTQAQQPNPSTLQNTSSTPINPNLTKNAAPVMPEMAPKPQTFGHPSDIPTQNNNSQAQQPNPSTLQNTSSTPINPNLTNNEAPVMPEKAPKPQTFGHPSDIPTQNNNIQTQQAPKPNSPSHQNFTNKPIPPKPPTLPKPFNPINPFIHQSTSDRIASPNPSTSLFSPKPHSSNQNLNNQVQSEKFEGVNNLKEVEIPKPENNPKPENKIDSSIQTTNLSSNNIHPIDKKINDFNNPIHNKITSQPNPPKPPVQPNSPIQPNPPKPSVQPGPPVQPNSPIQPNPPISSVKPVSSEQTNTANLGLSKDSDSGENSKVEEKVGNLKKVTNEKSIPSVKPQEDINEIRKNPLGDFSDRFGMKDYNKNNNSKKQTEKSSSNNDILDQDISTPNQPKTQKVESNIPSTVPLSAPTEPIKPITPKINLTTQKKNIPINPQVNLDDQSQNSINDNLDNYYISNTGTPNKTSAQDAQIEGQKQQTIKNDPDLTLDQNTATDNLSIDNLNFKQINNKDIPKKKKKGLGLFGLGLLGGLMGSNRKKKRLPPSDIDNSLLTKHTKTGIDKTNITLNNTDDNKAESLKNNIETKSSDINDHFSIPESEPESAISYMLRILIFLVILAVISIAILIIVNKNSEDKIKNNISFNSSDINTSYQTDESTDNYVISADKDEYKNYPGYNNNLKKIDNEPNKSEIVNSKEDEYKNYLGYNNNLKKIDNEPNKSEIVKSKEDEYKNYPGYNNNLKKIDNEPNKSEIVKSKESSQDKEDDEDNKDFLNKVETLIDNGTIQNDHRLLSFSLPETYPKNNLEKAKELKEEKEDVNLASINQNYLNDLNIDELSNIDANNFTSDKNIKDETNTTPEENTQIDNLSINDLDNNKLNYKTIQKINSATTNNPEKALDNFLKSNNIIDKLSYSLEPDFIFPFMKKYYKNSSIEKDLAFENFVHQETSQVNSDNLKIHSYIVNVDENSSFPVFLEDKNNGCKIDWLIYVQFRDNLLSKFYHGKQSDINFFRVTLAREKFEDVYVNVKNANKKHFFVIESPTLPSEKYLAYIDKNTPEGKEISRRMQWDRTYFTTLELKREETTSKLISDKVTIFKITAIPSYDWNISKIKDFYQGKNW